MEHALHGSNSNNYNNTINNINSNVNEITHLALTQQLNTMRIPCDFSEGVRALLNFFVRILPPE